MILTGDLHASPEELRFLKPEYLRNKFGSKCENTIIFILGDGGFLWHEDPYSDFNGELIGTLNTWLKELNSKCIVVPGNHENYKRIYSLPKVHLKERKTLKVTLEKFLRILSILKDMENTSLKVNLFLF